MKKGQSALEYLVTYGWAILAIVIIAATLWYFGIFNPAKWVGVRQCGGLSAFTCIDYEVNSTGDGVTISLGNKVGRTVYVTCADGDVNLAVTSPQNCRVYATSSGADQLEFTINYYDNSTLLTHTDTGFVTT